MNALEISKIDSALGGVREPSNDATNVFVALRSFAVAAANFGPGERHLLKVFQIERLDDPLVWSKLVGAATAEGRVRNPLALQFADRIRFTMNYLPRIIELLSTEATQRQLRVAKNRTDDNLESLQLLVIEESSRSSNPDRLITALESITLLYAAISDLEKLPHNTLSVIGCDSGSDKSFDFLGLTPAIRAVKEILLSVWDRVVFHRERQLEVRIELITKSVPALEQLNAMKEGGLLAPEECELIRRRIVAGVSKFLESGCTIPEIQHAESHQSRQLLAPSPKLLAAPRADSDLDVAPGGTPAPTADLGGSTSERTTAKPVGKRRLSSEELAQLQDLLDRAQQDDQSGEAE